MFWMALFALTFLVLEIELLLIVVPILQSISSVSWLIGLPSRQQTWGAENS